MGLDLNSATSNKATMDVSFVGQTVKVTYRPLVLTTERLENLEAKPTEGRTSESMFLEFFLELVADWDVRRGAKKVPLTTAALKTVPLMLLRAIYLQVMREAGSGEAESLSSDG